MVRHSLSAKWSIYVGCLVVAVAMGVPVAASESPYVSMEGRQIKALSADQIEGYETGQGMSLALAAELNGYPGPKHVLELRDDLELTEAQVQSTEEAFRAMKTAAADLGRQIVLHEQELDDSFASHQISAQVLSEKVSQIAELQGRLRTVHLQAHLEMMKILDHLQIRRYIELRGYQDGDHAGHNSGAGHQDGP